MEFTPPVISCSTFPAAHQRRKRVVDFTASMLEELESAAKDLNISRQAVIKTLIRQGLDQRQRARASRTRTRRS